jgi:hypothetical protein
MAVVGIVVALGLGLLLGLAYLSDRRDRRNDVDPKLRVQALVERRRQARRRRVDLLLRRRMGNRSAGDRPEPKPWER